jgi:hypothetical protein
MKNEMTYAEFDALPMVQQYHARGDLTAEQAIEFELWRLIHGYLEIDPATRTYNPVNGAPPKKVTLADMGRYEGRMHGLASALVIIRQGYKYARFDGPYNSPEELIKEMVLGLRDYAKAVRHD